MTKHPQSGPQRPVETLKSISELIQRGNYHALWHQVRRADTSPRLLQLMPTITTLFTVHCSFNNLFCRLFWVRMCFMFVCVCLCMYVTTSWLQIYRVIYVTNTNQSSYYLQESWRKPHQKSNLIALEFHVKIRNLCLKIRLKAFLFTFIFFTINSKLIIIVHVESNY